MIVFNNKVYIETHFTKDEMECHCGCKTCPDDGAILKLELARSNATKHVGKEFPFFITSGARCIEYNNKIGGVENSQHIPPDCNAFDISATNSHEASIIISECIKIGFTSFSYNKKENFVHVDMRPEKQSQTWIYK